MQPKIIKADVEHQTFLAEVERLAMEDPLPGTEQGDRGEPAVAHVGDEDWNYDQVWGVIGAQI
jgi:hypothetical protein